MIKLQDLNYEGIVNKIEDSDSLKFTRQNRDRQFFPKRHFDKYRRIIVPADLVLELSVEVPQSARDGEPIRNIRIWKDSLGVDLADEEKDRFGIGVKNIRDHYVAIVSQLGLPSTVRNISHYSHNCFTLNYYFAPDQNNIELTQVLFSGRGRRILTPELKKLNEIALNR